jgi:hypothetical protein
MNHRKPTTYCLLVSSTKSELFLSFFVSRSMANNQDIFIFEENLPTCKFCLKRKVYPAKRGDGHWHSQIFWRLVRVITMTLCNRNYELKEITNSSRVSLYWLTDLKILNTEVRLFHFATLWVLKPKTATHSLSPELHPSV